MSKSQNCEWVISMNEVVKYTLNLKILYLKTKNNSEHNLNHISLCSRIFV